MSTRGELQVTWGGADSITLTPTTMTQLSDPMVLSPNIYKAVIQLKAVAAGAPAATDIVYFSAALAAPTAPDGAGAAEYDTTRNPLAAIDTNDANPGRISANLAIADSVKIFADGAAAGITQDITVSATITEFISA